MNMNESETILSLKSGRKVWNPAGCSVIESPLRRNRVQHNNIEQ